MKSEPSFEAGNISDVISFLATLSEQCVASTVYLPTRQRPLIHRRGAWSRHSDHMAARGPDGRGEWIRTIVRVGLATAASRSLICRRRRPANVERRWHARQTSQRRDLQLSRLRAELRSKGYVFRTNSDTEVLLHLYADDGEAMVHDLRGMFAFAIWDDRKRRLFLARDPYGIKPLYCADDGDIRFASQVKALLAGGEVSREPTPPASLASICLAACPSPSRSIARSARCRPVILNG